ncbi:adenylate/guanylate cyclase domain-containing protein [Patescibacteria group bacterium]
MPEVNEEQIRDYEVFISKQLLELWEQPTDDVSERVQRALEITAEADELLSPEQKVTLAYAIKALMKGSRSKIKLDLGMDFYNQLELSIQQIIDSKGGSGPGFMELHRAVTTRLDEMDELSETDEDVLQAEIEIAQIKATVLKILRSMVADRKELALAEKKVDMNEAFDELDDELREKKLFEEIMGDMLDLLRDELEIRGAAIFYNEPLKASIVFDDDNMPEANIGARKILSTAEISQGNVRKALSLTKDELDEGAEHASQEIEVGEGVNTYWVMPIEIRELRQKLGSLVLVTEGNADAIDDDFIELLRYVESHVDSVVDEAMNNMCKQRLAVIAHGISTSTNISNLPNAYEKYLSLLQKVLGVEITFVYNEKFNDNGRQGFRVTQNGIIPIGNEEAQSLFIDDQGDNGEWGDNGYFVSLFDKRGDLITEIARKQGESVPDFEPFCAGTVIIEGTKPITEGDRERIDIIIRALHQDVLERRGEHDKLTMGMGRYVAEYALEGELALKGTFPAAICFVDVVGSTELCTEIGAPEYADGLNVWYSGTSEIEAKRDRPGHVDKYIGDGIMMTAGVPCRADGSSFSGDSHNKKGEFLLNIFRNLNRTKKQRGGGKGGSLNAGIAYEDKVEVRMLGRKGGKGEAKRMEYTVIGDAVHIAARLESVAEDGETLIRLKDFEYLRKHIELLKNKGEWNENDVENIQRGVPTCTLLKGLFDPHEIVSTITTEELEEMERKQEEVFRSKNVEEITFHSAADIPNGDYEFRYNDSGEDLDHGQIDINYRGAFYKADIPLSELPQPVTKWVSIKVHKEILAGDKPKRILRAQNGKLFIINYECVEIMQAERVQALKNQAKEYGLSSIHRRDLVGGDYAVKSFSLLDDGCFEFDLMRGSKKLKVIIPGDSFDTDVVNPKVISCRSGRFSCRDEGDPEWAYMSAA